MVRGRDFAEEDGPGSHGVVIINETMARRFFSEVDPVGQHLRLGNPNAPEREIIGVVRDSKLRTLDEAPQPFLYRPWAQDYLPNMTLLVRTSIEPHALIRPIRQQIQQLEPDLPAFDIATLEEQKELSVKQARSTAMLASLFGMVGIALATVGLFGMMAYHVALRKKEIGVRIALGAQRTDISRLILGQALRITLTGITGGILLSVLVGRLARAMLFGIEPSNGWMLTEVGVGMAILGLAAAWFPARRATLIDPMAALRE